VPRDPVEDPEVHVDAEVGTREGSAERPVVPAARFGPEQRQQGLEGGYLGERRLLPGRDGPPGADYDTLPPLKPLPRQLVAFAWRPGHPKDLRRRLALAEPDSDGERFRALAADFADSVAVARSDRITQLQASEIIADRPRFPRP
jgi:hypothetical protein